MNNKIQDNEHSVPKKFDWKLGLAVLTFLLGSGIIWRVIELRNQSVPPSFTVSAINTLAGDNVYETTNHFMDVDPAEGLTGLNLEWGLEIVPQYSGTRQYGEVRVLVKNERGDVVAEGQWDNFNNASQTLFISLNPFKFSQLVDRIDLHGGFSDNIFETKTFIPPETKFEIEIVQSANLNTALHTDELIVRNSPWYHYTALSKWNNNSIDVFVFGKNLGAPSDFAVMGEVYEITELPGYMWNPWPRIGFQQEIVSVETEGEFTVKLTFPEGSESAFEFEKGKSYLVHTYLIKRQNYIEFDNWSWDGDGERWRLGSFGNRLLVQP